MLEIGNGILHEAAQMVSPIFNEKSGRFCPALDSSISAKRCGSERITKLACPLNCPYNPFNPNSPQAFDAVLTKGMPAVAKWIEEGIGPNEWARRFDAMDRRFHPERDLPLIAFETQWAVVSMSMKGEAYAGLWQSVANGETTLRNDALIFLDKLSQSRVYLLQVTVASNELPYYTCRDILDNDHEYLYVDFGDQEPLEPGAVLFGRFLRHENCLYVIPGIFVGSGEVLLDIVDDIASYVATEGVPVADAVQSLLPEVWNICARSQDEFDGVDPDSDEGFRGDGETEPCRAELKLRCPKSDAVFRLRDHPLFVEEEGLEFGFDPLKETVFDIYVEPRRESPYSEKEDLDEFDEEFADEEEEEPVKVGTVYVDADTLRLSAMNGVELELIKALVKALVPSDEA